MSVEEINKKNRCRVQEKAVVKRVLKKVLSMDDIGCSARGNPEHWRLLLECGHVKYSDHSARTSIRALVLNLATRSGKEHNMRAVCLDCPVDREPDHDSLSLRDVKLLPREVAEKVLDDWETHGLCVDHLRKKFLPQKQKKH